MQRRCVCVYFFSVWGGGERGGGLCFFLLLGRAGEGVLFVALWAGRGERRLVFAVWAGGLFIVFAVSAGGVLLLLLSGRGMGAEFTHLTVCLARL